MPLSKLCTDVYFEMAFIRTDMPLKLNHLKELESDYPVKWVPKTAWSREASVWRRFLLVKNRSDVVHAVVPAEYHPSFEECVDETQRLTSK